jgi:hypothetical protein
MQNEDLDVLLGAWIFSLARRSSRSRHCIVNKYLGDGKNAPSFAV